MSVQSAVQLGGTKPRRQRLSPRIIRDNIAGFLFISPWLLHFVLLIAFAMFYSFRISLMETDLLSSEKFVGFANYKNLFCYIYNILQTLKTIVWFFKQPNFHIIKPSQT